MKLHIQAPEDAEQYFNQAINHHQNGSLKEAVELYTALLEFFPDAGIIHYNAAHAHSELGNHQTALTHYSAASDLSPEDDDIQFNLAHCLKKNQLTDKAAAVYQDLLSKNQDNIDALYNLANCFKDVENIDQAIITYRQVIEKDSKHKSAVNNLAFLLHKQGREDEAVQYYKLLLELDSDNVSARHMVAALTGENAETAPKDYVQSVFDNYSENYEESLVGNLGYQVPQKIKDIIVKNDLHLPSFNHFLDLGCGSGLGAEQFLDYNFEITGVDLSPKMLKLAADKEIYDALYCEDILTFLQGNSRQYDLILAADVLTYIGELESIFKELYNNSSEKALFVFSTEHCETHFELRKSGRFAHSPVYLRETARRSGWKERLLTATHLRKERGNWIEGTIMFVEKG